MPEIRDSCCQLFKKLKILPFKSQYTFFLLLFVAKNRDLCTWNSEIHNNNTRFSSDLHTPNTNLKTFQKGLFYFGIKVFNHLPTSIKSTSHDIRQFQYVLKSFLLTNSITRGRNILLGIWIEILVQCNNFKSKHLNNLSCNVSQYCFILLLLMWILRSYIYIYIYIYIAYIPYNLHYIYWQDLITVIYYYCNTIWHMFTQSRYMYEYTYI